MSTPMIVMIVAWAIAMTATVAAHALKPAWRSATKPILMALTAGLAGGLATSMARRPSRDDLVAPINPPSRRAPLDLDARGVIITPAPHERDHADPSTPSVHPADDRPGDPDYVREYVERAKRDGVL